MACGGCKAARADLKAAVAAGDVQAAVRAVGKGAKVLATKIKAPPVAASLLRRR